jgi:hypothetical protein
VRGSSEWVRERKREGVESVERVRRNTVFRVGAQRGGGGSGGVTHIVLHRVLECQTNVSGHVLSRLEVVTEEVGLYGACVTHGPARVHGKVQPRQHHRRGAASARGMSTCFCARASGVETTLVPATVARGEVRTREGGAGGRYA